MDGYNRGSDTFASSSSNPSGSTPTTSPTSRRRSSAAHTRPAGPPPNLPIPSIPGIPKSEPYALLNGEAHRVPNGGESDYIDTTTYSRPHVSSNATTSRSHHAPTSTLTSASSSMENLSDPPPRSILPTSSRIQTAPNGEQNQRQQDRNLLSPNEARTPTDVRPSSRRTLTRALELAKEAVALDGTDQDPYGAVVAYGRSVALLSEVMERVRRGEDSTESHRRPGRRRSVVAQEEEIRRLKSIHDTYADRMNILSLIYSIPPQPHSVASLYSSISSIDSTRASSPTTNTSTSPSSESSDSAQTHQYSTIHTGNEAPFSLDDYIDDNPNHQEGEVVLGVIEANLHNSDAPISPKNMGGFSAHHPYARQDATHTASTISSIQAPNRASVISRRIRAPSNLPPAVPPPSASPPPPPPYISVESSPNIPPAQPPRMVDASQASRLRGNLTTISGHQRTGSGSRLASLQEEQDRAIDGLPGRGQVDGRPFLDTSRTIKRESHPLPPLPSPPLETRNDSPEATPRHVGPERPPPLSTSVTARTRNGSSASTPSQLINASPSQGTISQRRFIKSSAPPSSMRPPSPTGSVMSIGSIGSVHTSRVPHTASVFPTTNSALGRARAVSQPGRRPSIVGSQEAMNDQRPPLPITPSTNGSTRNYSARPSNVPLVVQTDLPSIFVTQQAAVSGAIPLTPTSPLPPVPPNDPLRKPYHMMSLLRTTMESPTGGYVTRRLHVPQEVWSQGGAKLTNLGEKVRAVEILCASLEELQTSSSECFGAGNVSSGLALGIGSIGRKEGESWVLKLDDFSAVCEGVVANFGKKLGVGEGFVLKKNSGVTSWGSKLTRRLDKLTNGKNLDSPAAYVQGLKQLFLHAQLLDEHTRAVLSSPIAPAYEALPLDVRVAAETKLRRSSEFFASVILTFVIRDLSQLLDKYAKKCEKWLAE